MAYTQDQLEALEEALATGYLSVKHSDGKSVEYRSIPQLKAAIKAVRAGLASQSGGGGGSARRTVAFIARNRKGL